MPSTAPKKLDYRYAARQRVQPIGTVDIAMGQARRMHMPSVGMLSNIILNVSADVTFSAAPVMTTNGPFDLLKRLRFSMNLGQADIFNCGGFDTAIVNAQMLRAGYNPLNQQIALAPGSAGPFPATVHWEFSLVVPIAMNGQLQQAIGLVNLQAPEVQADLEITFGVASDFCSNVSAVTGTVTGHYEFYDAPRPELVQYPPVTIVRTLSETRPLLQTGDYIYEIPRAGSLLQLAHIVRTGNPTVLNATLAQGFPGQSNIIAGGRIRWNRTDTVYEETGRCHAVRTLMDNLVTPGAWVWNWLDAGPTRLNDGDFRDAFPVEKISTLESILTIDPAAVMGPNSNVTTIRRTVQKLKKRS